MNHSALPDKIFFPLMLIIIASMVWLATHRSGQACPTGSVSGGGTDYNRVEISGTQLNRFIPKQGLKASDCTANSDYVLELRATDASFPAAPDAGPHFRLATDLQAQFSNQKIAITVRARTSPDAGAKTFQVNYSTGPEGASGWQTFALTAAYADYAFEYAVPETQQGQGVDFLGLRPIVEGEATGIEIESVTFVRR